MMYMGIMKLKTNFIHALPHILIVFQDHCNSFLHLFLQFNEIYELTVDYITIRCQSINYSRIFSARKIQLLHYVMDITQCTHAVNQKMLINQTIPLH
jgi:hypothetical protein